jgi:uncharacterized protein (DUF433 family)
MERLGRAARRLGRTPSEAASLLLEEALRQAEFAFIEFRDSPVGRQAYLKGTRLAVWQVAWLARSLNLEAERLAAHIETPPVAVAAALAYAATYPVEVQAAIADQEHAAVELPHLVPTIEVVHVDAPAS